MKLLSIKSRSTVQINGFFINVDYATLTYANNVRFITEINKLLIVLSMVRIQKYYWFCKSVQHCLSFYLSYRYNAKNAMDISPMENVGVIQT